jgi:tRNA threonylcarbamoyladenosine biosynthesis protein TsaE
MVAARTVETRTEAETIALGEALAARLRPGDVVALYGTLGTGKTRFIKGICRGLGVGEHVTSPTFTIVNEYRGGAAPVYHFDFYRLKDLRELREIGFEEYLFGEGVCLLEWAERVRALLPPRRYDVMLAYGPDEMSRRVTIEEVVGVPA